MGHPADLLLVLHQKEGLPTLEAGWVSLLWVGHPRRCNRQGQADDEAGALRKLTLHLDETRLASGSFDGTAKLWDLQSGQELFAFYGNASNVFGVALSPDGHYLATTGGDGTLRVFTLKMEDLISLAQSRITRSLSEAECQKYLHRNCP